MTKGPLSKSDARVTKSQIKGFKLIANDELGSRCLKGQWGAKCNKQRGGIQRVVQYSPQERPLTGTVTLNQLSGDTYLREYLPEKILTKPRGGDGGEGARIRNDSQEGKN